jgi:hypothetical protein
MDEEFTTEGISAPRSAYRTGGVDKYNTSVLCEVKWHATILVPRRRFHAPSRLVPALRAALCCPERNQSDVNLVKNADGSVDLYFAAKAPAGFENNWIPTVPGKAWLAYFRLYGPMDAYFDKSWPLPDIQNVNGRAVVRQDLEAG